MRIHAPLRQQSSIGAHAFAEAQAALRFMTAGNARFTLRSKVTGTRYTYRMRRDESSPDAAPVFFVDLLKGPDNNADYSYIGMIRHDRFSVTQKTKHLEQAAYTQAFQHAIKWLVDGHKIHSNLEIWHESRCGRCGRTLTVPESVMTGLGPECVKMGPRA